MDDPRIVDVSTIKSGRYVIVGQVGNVSLRMEEFAKFAAGFTDIFCEIILSLFISCPICMNLTKTASRSNLHAEKLRLTHNFIASTTSLD